MVTEIDATTGANPTVSESSTDSSISLFGPVGAGRRSSWVVDGTVESTVESDGATVVAVVPASGTVVTGVVGSGSALSKGCRAR